MKIKISICIICLVSIVCNSFTLAEVGPEDLLYITEDSRPYNYKEKYGFE
jgi:hypothetical protein